MGVAIVAVALFVLWQDRQGEEHKLSTDAPPTHNQIQPGGDNEESSDAVTGRGAEESIRADGRQAHQEKVASPTLKTKIPGVKVRSLIGPGATTMVATGAEIGTPGSEVSSR